MVNGVAIAQQHLRQWRVPAHRKRRQVLAAGACIYVYNAV